MCNYLHGDSSEIPKTGTGWKIVRTDGTALFKSDRYTPDSDGWINWDDNNVLEWNKVPNRGDMGFCFFLDRTAASLVLKYLKRDYPRGYENCVIRKISYKQGLGKHIEDNMISDQLYEIALCKRWKLLPTKSKKKLVRFAEKEV